MCVLYTNVRTCLFNRYNFIPRIQKVSGQNMENIQYQANHNEGGEHSILIKYRALIY